MRTFRITLSHGSERVTFDGAGARSGSMFHVRRDAIEGLWSSPASKVSLTERETANGASPISDGETLYAARTVVIPFAIQSNYDHTSLIRARTLLGRLIGWHDVRMDINDDGDETVLNGYIEAKYSDIPYDHTDAGVITVVCPDPRRISKHESTISMNTSSSSLGGLSFGVPAYELAWTGTPNASTSTLSQDGSVVATNHVLDPNLTNVPKFHWGNSGLTVSSYVEGNLHIVRYSHASGAATSPVVIGKQLDVSRLTLDSFSVMVRSSVALNRARLNVSSGFAVPADTVNWTTLHTDGTPGSGFDNSSILSGWEQALDVNSEWYIEFARPLATNTADWTAMQALDIDWFTGDSQSPQPNAGLAFPLDFGQTGNAGNTGMIANNGSYVSMPAITAHGWLDNGLTIHWNTSDGNEGDLSFTGGVGNVPVTINTDTHSAIMGGLDVSYQLGSRDWPRIPAGGSCSFALLASGGGWVTVQSNDTYM